MTIRLQTQRQRIGRQGERRALLFLLGEGYALVEKNARTPYGELDLVMERDGTLIAVEVKTRRTERFGSPESAVTPRKLQHMMDAFLTFADQMGWVGPLRMDVVAIGPLGTLRHLEHIRTDELDIPQRSN